MKKQGKEGTKGELYIGAVIGRDCLEGGEQVREKEIGFEVFLISSILRFRCRDSQDPPAHISAWQQYNFPK